MNDEKKVQDGLLDDEVLDQVNGGAHFVQSSLTLQQGNLTGNLNSPGPLTGQLTGNLTQLTSKSE